MQYMSLESQLGETLSVLMSEMKAEWRHYHNADHLEYIWNMHQRFDTPTTWEAPIVYATLYHDFVYNAASKTNEIDSNAVFKANCVGYHPQLIEKVSKMILATADHFAATDNSELTQWFLDLDLASFAAPWPEFVINNENIKREFMDAGIAEADFLKGSSKFLSNVLKQPKIYRAGIFPDIFEYTARENIQRLLNCRYPYHLED
jgi:predicted metal-dependent HD superfamily phosphohydrolase